jgi:FtsZ-binding cell division protein ZapB
MYFHRYLISTGRGSIMTQDNMITELTDTVKHLRRDVDSLKENNKYLYSKLEKAYDDRITLRAENHKLKNPVNTPIMQESEEEECISCSA